ncbi:MAG TPA: glycogen debranching protein GlgX [Anaerolineaceae bacterium]
MREYTVWPGKPYPLGATWNGEGVNFAVFNNHAGKVELCLFDESGEQEIARLAFHEYTNETWHMFVPGIQPGQLYAYRVQGEYNPEAGHRFNPAKLLLDPYARAIDGDLRWDDALFGYTVGAPEDDLSCDPRDSAPFLPKCVVVDSHFEWEGDTPPGTPFYKTVIYETHVKGFTAQHPDIPAGLRGTYAGLCQPPAIEYLQKLGVTAVEFLPIHQFISDRHLVTNGLTNYWGYNSIGFFAPHAGYASRGTRGEQVTEFKEMVKVLHRAGIEVILDVVYNHTGEGNHMGPTLSFRGLDNASYYRLMENPRFYMDYTGTGNTLNMVSPNVPQLIMDSLRYWIEEMHVDGFRFDLAATLARELHDVDRLGSFFDIIRQDPVISQVKLIAEPWDLGEGGYQVGNFPSGWAEWNGKYRDTVRDYWRSADSTLAEFAARFTGSSDLYSASGRRPTASINFITAHDGFTLNDLVSYNEKHNEANGEDNRDGESHNRSWNCGEEGPSDSEEINQLRSKMKRNFLATLLLSQGVPMILAGDEFGRTQQGNNNAYCQDNEISWLDWEKMDGGLLEFTRRLIAMRREHPVFRQRRWFEGRPLRGSEARDIGWFTPDGAEMTEDAWKQGFAKSLMVYLNGGAIRSPDQRGNPIMDSSFLLLFNAHFEPLDFTLPGEEWGRAWCVSLDTADDARLQDALQHNPGSCLTLESRSLVVLQHID